jgi:hypothetical protein
MTLISSMDWSIKTGTATTFMLHRSSGN